VTRLSAYAKLPWVKRAHIAGLDALRFVAALWVVIGHVGEPPVFLDVDRTHWAMWAVTGAYNNLFSGPAAVIVFFVISGFCIHYPYAAGTDFKTIPFYLRRFIRIGLPLAFAIAISRPLGIEMTLFEDSILWSLVAELIYYAGYPLLRTVWKRIGLSTLVVTSYLIAAAVVMTDPGAGNYPSYGWKLNWLLGLPCWLLGVKLADRWATGGTAATHVGASEIWRWRLGIWMLSAVCSVLRFHSPAGYPWTLDLFAIAVFFWLDREIARGFTRPPSAVLEWAGRWSYSIYLVHVLAMSVYRSSIGAMPHAMLNWFAELGFILAVSYLYYLVVEARAHDLARFAAARASQRLRPLPRDEVESRG
jgi:peptidoglycan/LPS O-acetylase OafA/YrhL